MKLLEKSDSLEPESKKLELNKSEKIVNPKKLSYQVLCFFRSLWQEFIKSQPHMGGWNPNGFRNPKF